MIIFILTECRSGGGGGGDVPASLSWRSVITVLDPVSIPDVNLPILLHLNLVSHRVKHLPTNISQAYNF